jgi:C1A family cysteine protease
MKDKKQIYPMSYGWKPDHHDPRDLMFKLTSLADLAALPSAVDLRPGCPPVYDQGNLGSCTANAIGGAHQFDQLKQPGGQTFVPSRLFIYYNERAMEGTTGSDAGAQIRDGMKSINDKGVCPETQWPYDIARFKTKPPIACYTEGLKHQSIEYLRVTPLIDQVKSALAAGFPVVFGFTVYASFESQAVAKTGNMPMPKRGEQVMGGHAVLAVGYDDARQVLIVRNSWGPTWGDKGYFYMPYSVITANMARDFWTLKRIEE